MIIKQHVSPLEQPELSLQQISASYGGVSVLDGVTLSIRRGESLAIIGPSGSGKSTLLRCITLLQQITSGSIFHRGMKIVDGHDSLIDANTFRRSVGMVHQELNLWPNKTVLGNLTEAPRFVLGWTRPKATAQAREWLERLGIAQLEHRFPCELSGGQRQRVALGRALVMQTPVLVLDEVTSGLDVETTEQLLVLLESLRDSERTFIFVSHHLVFAERATDRTAVLIDGRIQEIGPSSAVIREPQNDCTRRFLSVVRATY